MHRYIHVILSPAVTQWSQEEMRKNLWSAEGALLLSGWGQKVGINTKWGHRGGIITEWDTITMWGP